MIPASSSPSPMWDNMRRMVHDRVSQAFSLCVPETRIQPEPVFVEPQASVVETAHPRVQREASACSVTTTNIIFPSDADKDGSLLAGPLLKWIDSCACMAAERFSRVNCVTVSMDDIHFMTLPHVGEVVHVKAVLQQAWKTSMEVSVTAHVDRLSGQSELCCIAITTFVARDRSVLPQLVLSSDEERASAEMAEARRAFRLKESKVPDPEPRLTRYTTVCTELVLPHHCQHMGTTFGGWTMHWAEIASSIAASRHTRAAMVCVSTDSLKFLAPSGPGDVLEFRAIVTAGWKTSLEIGCWVYSEKMRTGDRQVVCQMYATYAFKDRESNCRVLALPSDSAANEPEMVTKALSRRTVRLQRKTLYQSSVVSIEAAAFGERQAKKALRDFLVLSQEGKDWEQIFDARPRGLPLSMHVLEGHTVTCFQVRFVVGASPKEMLDLVNPLQNRKEWDKLLEKSVELPLPPGAASSFSDDEFTGSIKHCHMFYGSSDVVLALVCAQAEGCLLSVAQSVVHPAAPPQGPRFDLPPSGWMFVPKSFGAEVTYTVQMCAKALKFFLNTVNIKNFVTGEDGASAQDRAVSRAAKVHDPDKSTLPLVVEMVVSIMKRFPVLGERGTSIRPSFFKS